MIKPPDLFYGADNTSYPKQTADKFIHAFNRGEFTRSQVVNFVGFHIEAGNASFIDFSNASIHFLGERAVPHLKDWYLDYLASGKYFSEKIDKDQKEIDRIYNYLSSSINFQNNDKQILKDIQRDFQDRTSLLPGKLPDVDQHEGPGTKDGEPTKKTADSHSPSNQPTAKSHSIDRELDADNSTIHRTPSHPKGHITKSQSESAINTPRKHPGVHSASSENSSENNPPGDNAIRNHSFEDKIKDAQILNNLQNELELVFDVTDTITGNAKVLSKYFLPLGEKKVYNSLKQFGFDVVKDNKGDVTVTKKQASNSLIVYNNPDEKIRLGNKYWSFKQLKETRDFSIIAYGDLYAVVYANNEIEATTTDINEAEVHMNKLQKEFDLEINEIKINSSLDFHPFKKKEKKFSLAESKSLELTEYFIQKHSKNNKILHTLAINSKYRLPEKDFKELLSLVKAKKGYYSSYGKNGMKTGFILKSAEDAQEFQKQADAFILERLKLNREQGTIVDESPKFQEAKNPLDEFINAIKGKLGRGEKIVNTPALRKIAEECNLQSGRDYTDIKNLYDIASNALNQYIIENAPDFKVLSGDSNERILEIIKRLDSLQNLLPTETERSFEMVALQQFSTPLSMSLVANLAAEIGENDVVLEPSAGEGNLVVFPLINNAKVIANEIDPKRTTLLKKLGTSKVTTEDAKHIHAIIGDQVTTVVLNPPFSRDIKKGNKIDIEAGRKHVESALLKLNQNGRLVAILGRGMGMNASAQKSWWEKIKREYNVRANILVNGDAYKKKGTSFDNRLIIIDKIGPTEFTLEKSVDNYSQLFEVLNKVPRKQKINLKNEQDRKTETANYREIKSSRRGKSLDSRNANSNLRGESNSEIKRQQAKGTGHLDLQSQSQDNGIHHSVDGRDNRAHSGENNPRHFDVGKRTSNALPGNGSSLRDSAGIQRDFPKHALDTIKVSYRAKTLDSKNNIGYDKYVPEIIVKGAKPHPANLVESTAMSSVSLPKVLYVPNLSPEIIQSGALSQAQLEDIILAGAATKQKLADGKTKGYFLGGGTGYGKGRTLAAIILDNLNSENGSRKALWLSKNENAHYDSADYWQAVGGDKNIIIKNVKAGQPILIQEGVLLATYGMLANKFEPRENERSDYWKENPKSRLQQIAQWLTKDFDGVIVFDEAHMMGNAIDTKGERGTKRASQRALAGIELQNLLPKAKIIYSSATGATEVMNLAYAQRLGLWGDGTAFSDVHEFINAIDSSGVAGMELVSRDLKAMGVYTSKSLSFDGVKYETLQHELYPEQKELYDKVARAWQIVLQNINEAIKANNTSSNKQMHIMSAFWGAHQRFFQQVITTMQMPTVLADMEKEIESGKSPIIQLINTNEAVTQRELAEKKASSTVRAIDYDSLELSPKNILLEYIAKGFPTQLYEKTIDDKGNEISVAVSDSEGNPIENPLAVQMRDKLLNDIDSEIHLPEAPLDIIINHFGPDNVSEVTGRSNRIVLREDEEGVLKKIEERRTKSTVSKDKDDFMDGRKPVLVFSEAGGTGASFHADKTRKNQNQRVHYVLQAGWRADAAVQGFGRSHRSNQAVDPIFKLVTTNLKAQRRFLSSIARRLDQLGALTKGQRQTGGQGILDGTFNLEGAYARQALFEFYQNVEAGNVKGVSMRTLEKEMALKIYKEDPEGGREYNDNVIFNTKMFLNRIMSLEVDVMDRVFESYMFHIQEQIDRAKKKGTYDQGIETVKALNTNVINEHVVYKDKKTGARTFLTDIQLELENNKISFEEILDRMDSYPKRFQGFYREKTSGKPYAIVKNEFASIDGTLETLIRRFSVVAETHIEKEDFQKKYEPINLDQAKVLWVKEFQEYPATRKKTETIVKGTILPIWGNLPESVNVRRYLDNAGTPHLGRFYNKKDVSKIRARFNALQNIEYDINEIIDLIKKGGKAELGNSFLLSKKKHQGIDEITIENVRAFKERGRLEKSGATFKLKNSLGSSGEFYISFSQADKVIEKILQLYGTSIVNAEDSNGNPIKGRSKEEITELKEEKNADTIGYRNYPSGTKELFENLLKVIDIESLKYWQNYHSGEYGDTIMRLNVEKQELYDAEMLKGIGSEGAFKLVMSQNYIQNGDLMDDPRIDLAVFPKIGIAYPLNFQQHGFPTKYEEYIEDKRQVLSKIAGFNDIVRFLNKTWLPNLVSQDRVIKTNLEAHMLSQKELIDNVIKGNIVFEAENKEGKISIQDLIKVYKETTEPSKLGELKNQISNLCESFHISSIEKAIKANRYVPSKALRGYKKFNLSSISLYKKPQQLSLQEYLKAEVICIEGSNIVAKENSDGTTAFSHGETYFERTMAGYKKACGGEDIKDEYLKTWITKFEQRKFDELARDPILMYGHNNKYYIEHFEKFLGVDSLPSNLDKMVNRYEFLKILDGVHKERFGKKDKPIFDDQTEAKGELKSVLRDIFKEDNATYKPIKSKLL